MKEKIVVNGGKRLCGEIEVESSKNAFLPILAACVLCEGFVELSRYTNLTDLVEMRKILANLNISTEVENKILYLDCRYTKISKITTELTQNIRASIFLLGPLVARFKKAVIAYPGGCKIGARPINIHLEGLRALGVKIIERHGYIYCDGTNAKSAKIELNFPSVGATESLMMCATLLEGTTKIFNAAKEPEVEDLQNFLNSMGAKVSGAGTDIITIDGVQKLHSTKFETMSDRIIAGTYLLAVASCGGEIMLKNTNPKHNKALLRLLRQTACQIETRDDKIILKADKRCFSINKVVTMPYPMFPTDLQPQMMTFQSVSEGVSVVEENLFENRFGLVPELRKMGAKIETKGNLAIVRGVEKLYGAEVEASDLRAGAGLVLAGLKAEGYTTISNVNFIDRGYEEIENKYKLLGADIERIKIE